MLVWVLLCTTACAQTYEARLASLYQHSVDTISTTRLAEWLEYQSVIILDTREPEEFAVSHIDQAKLIPYDSFDPQMLDGFDRSAPVVVYCTVGYRSERIGEQLQDLGFSKVYNLYGGIFQWKNDGYQVVNPAGEPTEKVHTYSKGWSKWLQQGEKVY